MKAVGLVPVCLPVGMQSPCPVLSGEYCPQVSPLGHREPLHLWPGKGDVRPAGCSLHHILCQGNSTFGCLCGCLCAPGGTRDFCTTWSPAPGIWKCLLPGTGPSRLLPQNYQPQRQTPSWQLIPQHPWPVEQAGAALRTEGGESPPTWYCPIHQRLLQILPRLLLDTQAPS